MYVGTQRILCIWHQTLDKFILYLKCFIVKTSQIFKFFEFFWCNNIKSLIKDFSACRLILAETSQKLFLKVSNATSCKRNLIYFVSTFLTTLGLRRLTHSIVDYFPIRWSNIEIEIFHEKAKILKIIITTRWNLCISSFPFNTEPPPPLLPKNAFKRLKYVFV